MAERALNSFLLLIWLNSSFSPKTSHLKTMKIILESIFEPFFKLSILQAAQKTNTTRNQVRQNAAMDLLTYFSQSEHANFPQGDLYHHKSFARTELLEYRKLEEFVKQTSPVPLCPCKHTLYSNLALSPEASSGCLNRSKLFAAPSSSLRKVFLFNILKTRLFAPCSPQQFLGLQPATGSPGVVSLLVTPHLMPPHSLHSSGEAVTFPTPPAATGTRQTGRFLLPACLHLFEVQTPVDYKRKKKKKMKKMPPITVQ